MARVLTLSDEIDLKTVKDIIHSIQVWNLEDEKADKEKKDFKREIIHLMINSNGGDAYCGMGFATMVKSSKTPIHTYCVGEAMSAGFMIFICGHKRYCYSGSTFLYHQVAHGNGCIKLNKLNTDLEEVNKLEKRLEKIVIENTKITQEQMDNINNRNLDWYISAEEALELGIIEEII